MWLVGSHDENYDNDNGETIAIPCNSHFTGRNHDIHVELVISAFFTCKKELELFAFRIE